MVAYSFKAMFAPQIVTGVKRQTVRGHRRRHARPGEAVQLYQAMRTRDCQKIILDPTCTSVLPIVISFDSAGTSVDWLEIDGSGLNADQMEEFARADGFDPQHVALGGTTALENFLLFWNASHGLLAQFDGALIKWEPAR